MNQADTTNISVAFIGQRYWCDVMRAQLTKRGVSSAVIPSAPANPLKRLGWVVAFLFYYRRKYEILHIVGIGSKVRELKWARWTNMLTVWHWIGSDVLKIDNLSKRAKKKLLRNCHRDSTVRLAVSERLSEELSKHGINTEVLRHITDKVVAEPEPLPSTPGVLSYWTDNGAGFFNSSLIFDLAKCFPEIRFRIVGTMGKGLDAPPNVHFFGWLEDMSEVLRQTTVYIRIVPHDGGAPPMMVAESLARGKYVIYSLPFPHCEQGRTLDEVKAKLEELLEKREPNFAGAEFVRTKISPDENTARLIEIYQCGMANIIKKIPLISVLARRRIASEPEPFLGSEGYWIQRYQSGKDSGPGSYNQLAEFKAEILNDFVQTRHIESIIEYGCGDGNQLRYAEYPRYLGFDVSPKAIELCKSIFNSDDSKVFKLISEYDGERADLTLSLDVIFHLVEDEIFESYMLRLFGSSDKFVIVYSSDTDVQETGTGPYSYFKHRNFTKWVTSNLPDWQLVERIPNKYPFTGNAKKGSCSDFFIYEKSNKMLSQIN